MAGPYDVTVGTFGEAPQTPTGLTPEAVERLRRMAQQMQTGAMGQASEVKNPFGVAGVMLQALGGNLKGQRADEAERQGRADLIKALSTASDPQAMLKAAVATPYGSQLMPHYFDSIIKRSDPLYSEQLTSARLQNQKLEKDLREGKLSFGSLKEGEIPYVRNSETGTMTYQPPPGFQPPGERERMRERVQLEEKERAKMLAHAQEAQDMAREIRGTIGHIVGTGEGVGPDGKPVRTYGDAPAKVFGTGPDGKPLKFLVTPEIFGPIEDSGINRSLQTMSPTIARGMDFVRGGYSVAPEDRLRQAGVLGARLQSLNATMTKAQNEGQGAVTNYEREMYAKAVASMKTGDISTAYSIMSDLEKRFLAKADAARAPYMQDNRPALVPVPNSAAQPSTRFAAPAGPVTTPPVRGGAPMSPAVPGAPTQPEPPSAGPPGSTTAAEPPRAPGVGRRAFDSLHPNDRRKAITTLARTFDDPQMHRNFIEEFGSEAYMQARAMAEKLRQGMAF